MSEGGAMTTSTSEGVTAHPLAWPPGWPRTAVPETARFSVGFEDARRELEDELARLGARSVTISTNDPGSLGVPASEPLAAPQSLGEAFVLRQFPAHRDRRHRRPGATLDLQRLQHERELVRLLDRQFLQLHVLQQVDAVHHQGDLVHGQELDGGDA